MYGYWTKYGYLGKLKSGKWMLFANENEYIDYINDED